MTKLKRIRSFTISEMIVVLLITTIVVGMAFSILALVQKQMAGISTNYEKSTQLNLARQAFWIDFNTYNSIYYNDKTNSLICSNELTAINYIFDEEWILRNNDTIPVSIASKVFYFDGVKTLSGPIDAMELFTKEKGEAKKVFVYKTNTASTYIN